MRHRAPDHVPRRDPLHRQLELGQLGDEVRRPPHRVLALLAHVLVVVAAPLDLQVGDAAQRVVRAEEHHERLDPVVVVFTAVLAERLRGLEQRHRARPLVPARVHAQRGPGAVVLDDLVQQRVVGRGDRRLARLGGARERVADVPPVDREAVVVAGDHRRRRAGAALPVVLDLVHDLPGAEQRQRQLPRADVGAVAVLEVAQDVLQVQRQSAGPAVARVAVAAEPPQLAGDDRRVGEVRVVDRAALEALGERVADRDQAVPGRPASALGRVVAERGIEHGRARTHRHTLDDLFRRVLGDELIGHGARNHPGCAREHKEGLSLFMFAVSRRGGTRALSSRRSARAAGRTWRPRTRGRSRSRGRRRSGR